jgi:excisionase family DNA binding protein
MNFSPQQLDFPSLAFPKDRTVLTVGEVAAKWQVSDRHVIDLIEEGKLTAFDVAGKHEYVRVSIEAIDELATRLGVTRQIVLGIISAKRPQRTGSGRAFYRIPVVEGFNAFMRENHSFVLSGK